MRIGFFTNTYLPNIFGSTNSIEYFRKGLKALGHEVFVFAPRWRGYMDLNKNVLRYPALHWHYKIEYPLAISFYPPNAGLVKKLELDLVHIHQPFLMGKEGFRQAKRNGLPVVFTYHCKYEEYTHYAPALPDFLLKKYVKNQAIKMANKCDKVIAPSNEIKEMLLDGGLQSSIEVLPTGIDWEKFQAGNRHKIRRAYQISSEQKCLLWVGRLEREKNIALMRQVMAQVLKEKKEAVFLVVGEGSEKEALIKFFEAQGLCGRVFFTGLAPQEEIEDYYAASDLLVNFSLSETQGLVINEAMATGLAVASVFSTGANELIKNYQTGILMKSDFENCVQAINAIIVDSDSMKNLGAKAKEDAKFYDYREKAKVLEKIYKDLLKH